MNLELNYKGLTPAHLSLCGWRSSYTKAEMNGIIVQKTDDEIAGEQVVASTNLKLGQELLQELPFIRQLNDQNKSTYCSFCFSAISGVKKSCQNKQCKWGILYCSYYCQRQHWLTEHKWLCNFPELLSTDKDILFAFQGYIASRSVGEYILPGLVSNMNLHKPQEIKDYRRKIDKSILKKAFFLTEDVVEHMLTIGAQIRCNTFAVKDLATHKKGDIEYTKEVIVGRSIYLSASKFNHSCNPNVLASFGSNGIGSQLKLRLVSGHKLMGSEMSISYGPLCARDEKSKRQKELKEKYFFDCNCETCQLKYEPATSIYKCPQGCSFSFPRSEIRCPKCKSKIDWKLLETALSEAKKIQALASQKGDLMLFKKARGLLDKICIPKSLPVGEWWDDLAMKHVNNKEFTLAAQCIRESIAVIKSVFGDTSPEVATEMCKLINLLLSGFHIEECHREAEIAINLYKILGFDESREEDFLYLVSVASQTQPIVQ